MTEPAYWAADLTTSCGKRSTLANFPLTLLFLDGKIVIPDYDAPHVIGQLVHTRIAVPRHRRDIVGTVRLTELYGLTFGGLARHSSHTQRARFIGALYQSSPKVLRKARRFLGQTLCELLELCASHSSSHTP
jgi:hypothetical protein